LILGSYRFSLTPQSEPACLIESGPVEDFQLGIIPGTITFKAKFRVKAEQLDQTQNFPSWVPGSTWEIGFYQVVRSVERRVYKRAYAPQAVERAGAHRAFRGILGLETTGSAPGPQCQKTRIALAKPCRDGPGVDSGKDRNKPWYDGSGLTSQRWDFRLLSQYERFVDLELRLAPGIVIEDDPSLCGFKQEQMVFSTYLLFIDQQRRQGWTIRRWQWSADFAYYQDPITLNKKLKGPGIVLLDEAKQVVTNRRGLPDDSPPDTPVASDALKDLQHAAAPSLVNNIYYDMALDEPWS
jgi:hypothetical protein